MSTTHINEPTEQSEKKLVIQLGGEVSLRDYFAAKAMQGICAQSETWGLLQNEIAKKSYEVADSMLEARK